MTIIEYGWTVDFETMRMSMDDKAPKRFLYDVVRPRNGLPGGWFFRRNDDNFVGDWKSFHSSLEPAYQKWLVEKVVEAVILEEA